MTDSLGGEATTWVFSVNQIYVLSHIVPMECGYLYESQSTTKRPSGDELRLSAGTLCSLAYNTQTQQLN